MKKIIIFLSLLLFSSPLIGQTQFWHQTNGPEAGTVSNISIDSLGRVIVWTAGSGAFRSSDNGNTWELLNRGLPKAQLYIGAVTKSGYLIASNAAADGQLFRYNENDPYAQWENITPYNGTVNLIINDILTDGNTIYLAAGNHGILRSDDTGKTWLEKGHLSDTIQPKPPVVYDNNTALLTVDGNGNLFVGMAANGAIYRSSDRGESWTKLKSRCPDGIKTLSTLLVAPNGNIIIGTRERKLTSDAGRIFVSTDNTNTWDTVYQRAVNTPEQKNNIDKIIRVPGTNVIYANAHGPTLRSTDDGLTWSVMDTDKRGDEIFSMAAKDTNLYQLCEPDGIFLSNDSGKHWVPKNKGVNAEYMWGIAINSKQNVFGITEYGLWGTTDNGDSWDHKPEYGEDYNPSIFIDKRDNIFIGTNKGLYRSEDNGQTLDRVIIHLNDSTYGTDSLLHNIINQVGESRSGKLFCASNIDSIGFRYSPDTGKNWTKIPTLPKQQQPVRAFAFGSMDTVLATSSFLGTSSYYLSIDDGATWRLLNDSSNILAAQLLIHPKGSYLAREPGFTGGIFLSSDGAQNWGRIFPPADQTGLFKDYYYMMIDHTGNLVVCTDSGVYRSKDPNFSQWYSVSEGLSANDVPGHFINCVGVVENPVTHVFFAASHGLGVFKSITDLGVSDKQLAPIARNVVSAYPNPFHNKMTISFTLPHRENISLTIYDLLGRNVRSLLQGTFDEGEYTWTFEGSELTAGNYMTILRTEDGSYSSWITLVK
jgi:photosystem II stability/assembly factor-like uncharacterized protein